MPETPAVWITRDRQSIYMTTARPESRSPFKLASCSDFLKHFCYDEFSRVTGLKLRPGQSVKRRIRLEVVK